MDWEVWRIAFTLVMLVSGAIFILLRVFGRRRITHESDVDLKAKIAEITSNERARATQDRSREKKAERRKQLTAKYGDPDQ